MKLNLEEAFTIAGAKDIIEDFEQYVQDLLAISFNIKTVGAGSILSLGVNIEDRPDFNDILIMARKYQVSLFKKQEKRFGEDFFAAVRKQMRREDQEHCSIHKAMDKWRPAKFRCGDTAEMDTAFDGVVAILYEIMSISGTSNNIAVHGHTYAKEQLHDLREYMRRNYA